MVCDIFGNFCFYEAMKAVTIKPPCDCPNDCRSFGYSITVSASVLQENINCPKKNGFFKEFQGPLGLPKMFYSYYEQIVNKVNKNMDFFEMVKFF